MQYLHSLLCCCLKFLHFSLSVRYFITNPVTRTCQSKKENSLDWFLFYGYYWNNTHCSKHSKTGSQQHLLILHFLGVQICGGWYFSRSALSEFRSLPELRVHLESVDLLCCLLNKTRNTDDKKVNNKYVLLHHLAKQQEEEKAVQIQRWNDSEGWKMRDLKIKHTTCASVWIIKHRCGSSAERGSKAYECTAALEWKFQFSEEESVKI